MKKTLFFLLYFLIPTIPAFFYLNSLGIGFGFDPYAISVILGVSAFSFVCGQFILASRPGFAIDALGLKGLLAFHGTMPVFIVAMAAGHKLLKDFNGYPDDTLQATLGAISWWVLAGVIVFTVFLMANTFWLKLSLLKNLKAFIYKTFKLNYKALRIVHNITIVTGILLMVHVFLASTSGFKSNPAGIVFMGSWLIFSLASYARYKLSGMHPKERK